MEHFQFTDDAHMLCAFDSEKQLCKAAFKNEPGDLLPVAPAVRPGPQFIQMGTQQLLSLIHIYSGNAGMYITGPKVIEQVTYEKCTMDDIGSAAIHALSLIHICPLIELLP